MVLAQVCVTRSVGYSRSSLPVLPIILFIYSFTLLSRGLIWLNTIFELFFFTYVIWALLSTHPMVFAHSSTQTDQVCQSKTSNLNGYKEKGACEHMKYPSFPLRHVLSYLFLCVCVFFLPIFLNTLYIPFSLLRKVYPLVWLLQNYPSQKGMKEVGFVNTQDCQKNALNVAQNLLGSKYLIFLGYYCVRSQSLCTASMTQQ